MNGKPRTLFLYIQAMPITPTSLCHVTNTHFHADGRSVILVSRGSADLGDHLSPLITLQLNFLLMCVRACVCVAFRVIGSSRNKPSPPRRQVLRPHSQQVRRRRRRRRLSRLYRRRQPPPPSASSSSRRRQQGRPAWRRPTTR